MWGSLLPLTADRAKFRERFVKLFDQDDYPVFKSYAASNALFEHFEKRDFQRIYSFLAQNQLITFFRENLVEYMQQEIKMGNHAYNDTYVRSKAVEQELDEMKKFTTWAVIGNTGPLGHIWGK